MAHTVDELYEVVTALNMKVEFLTKLIEQRQSLSSLVLQSLNKKNIIEELKANGTLIPVE